MVGVFERAWRSDVLADCAIFGEWLVTLPEEVPVVEASQVAVSVEDTQAGPPKVADGTLAMLMDLGRRLEGQGNVAGAVEVYRQAQALAPAGSGPSEELALIVQDLQAKQEEVGFQRQQLLEQEAVGVVAAAAQSAMESADAEAAGAEPEDEMVAEAVPPVKQPVP